MCVAESQPSLQAAPQCSGPVALGSPLRKGEQWGPQLGLGTRLHFPACFQEGEGEGEWESKPFTQNCAGKVLESRLSFELATQP